MFKKLMDSLFGCHHDSMSRVFTLQHRSYRVCYDCGREFNYSLASMRIAEQPYRVPAARRSEVMQMPVRAFAAEPQPVKLGRARA